MIDFWNLRTQSKIHGGFVTFYPIHFGHLKSGMHWGYPKYCYSKPGRKDYTIKLKRNGVLRLPNYLVIEENVVLRFLRPPPKEFTMPSPTSRLITKELLLFTVKFWQLDLEWWNCQLFQAFWGYCDIVATNEVTY